MGERDLASSSKSTQPPITFPHLAEKHVPTANHCRVLLARLRSSSSSLHHVSPFYDISCNSRPGAAGMAASAHFCPYD